MTALETRPLQVNGNGNGHNSNGHTSHNGARLPPAHIESEQALLGAIMLSERALADSAEVVDPADFYKPAHGHIYAHALQLAAKGEPADPVTLADSLAGAGLLDQCGGLDGLVALQADTPATSKAVHYARIIAGHALLRRLIGVAGEIAEIGYARPDNPTDAVDRAEQLLYALTDRRTTGTAEPVAEVALRWLSAIEDRYTNGPAGRPTGLAELDDVIGGGLAAPELYFFAARPAMGKSNIGIQFGYKIAAASGLPALVFSLEMPSTQVMSRIVAAEGRIDNQRLRSGRLLESDWPKISTVMGRVADVPLYIYDQPEVTLGTIRAQTRRLKQAAGQVGLVVVDYLQLMAAGGRSENRQLEVDTFARGLKLIARSLNVPIVALCQVNRNVEARADKRPTLGDLRESGGIEAHGDTIIAVYRDEVYHRDSNDRGIAELIVLKQREGPLATVKVAYLSHFGIFANMARV